VAVTKPPNMDDDILTAWNSSEPLILDGMLQLEFFIHIEYFFPFEAKKINIIIPFFSWKKGRNNINI
jgi:hypothetical protein